MTSDSMKEVTGSSGASFHGAKTSKAAIGRL
jgi:hypothetical protein